jgi:hypothetical protein
MVVGEFAQEMRQHHHHPQVGGIAMQAAHHAGMIPVVMGEFLDREIGALDAGIEEDEKIDAADGDDPIEEIAKRAELGDRIHRRPEQPIERPLDRLESVP